jgi:hypothetical protein
MERQRVYDSVDSERDWQDCKWGTIDKRPHEVGAWLTLMRTHLADAERAWSESSGDYLAMDELRKVLAIGVACAEQHGIQFRSKHQEMKRVRNGSAKSAGGAKQ